MAKAPLQLLVNLYDGTLEQGRVDFDKYRKMRIQPTIALVRDYFIATQLAASWTSDSDEDDEGTKEQLDFINEHILPLRTNWLRGAIARYIDFGWSAWEVEYEIEEGLTTVKCINALKNDWTQARYYVDAGGIATRDFAGLLTKDWYSGKDIYIDELHGLFCSIDEEDLGGYGEGLLKRLTITYDAWLESMNSFIRYNNKMAGGFLMIKAPVGRSLVQADDDVDGLKQERDNMEIASKLASTMKTNGAFCVPAQEMIAGMQSDGWTVEFVESKGQQQDFVDGLSYLDKLFIRAFGIADRAVLESDFGSRADSQTATDAASLNLQCVHERLTDYFNERVVDPLLTVNFGEPKAWLKAVPLGDDRVEMYKEILKMVMADPGIGPVVCERVDVDQLADVINIPLKPEEELVINDPEIIAEQRQQMPPAPGEEEDDNEEGVPA